MSIEDIAFKLETASSTRTAAVIGIIAAIGGPIAMIAFGGSEASKLPWFIWAIVSLVLLLVVGLGYYLFTRNHDSKDISINIKSREDKPV
jgi:drug/metabolite transporter (DMT)-like permease